MWREPQQPRCCPGGRLLSLFSHPGDRDFDPHRRLVILMKCFKSARSARRFLSIHAGPRYLHSMTEPRTSTARPREKALRDCDDYPCRPVAASVRRNISFPAPRTFHPDACKRRRQITDQSSIKPSSTEATPNPQSSAPFSSQRLRKTSTATAAPTPNPHSR